MSLPVGSQESVQTKKFRLFAQIMKKITVVTAVINGERFIRKTIASVLQQQGDFELEYIVKDGGSTDSTMDILKEYSDRCIVVSEKDNSPQEAINKGFEMATGEIGCFLNADDVFVAGALQQVISAFENNPGKMWLYGRCGIIDENDREIRKPITLYKNILGFIYSRNVLLCENFINQPATFWKMDLWRKINGLDNKYKAAYDYGLWLKMADVSPPIHIRAELAKFRRHSESISENYFVRQFQEELNISKNYGKLWHYFIHLFNYYKIIAVYKFLR
jgi:glycosyltransferase involved in cell wall biosynthesis